MKSVKLSPPRTQNAIARPRLFALLDDCRRRHQLVWICSPPGAGKTTLAATYLANHQPPALWYHVDEGDTDLQTLLHFLELMVDDGAAPLPTFSDDDHQDIGRFARLFFRDFYSRLPAGSVLVFDNAQNFDWKSVGSLLEAAISEIPEDRTILFLSRSAPPNRLSRHMLNGHLCLLNWDNLRFTPAEARQFALIDDNVDDRSAAWLENAQGWGLGLQFLRSYRLRLSHDDHVPPLIDERESMLRYFSGEIFERLADDEQQWLLRLAQLPAMSAADAEQMAGSVKASILLRRLHHDRFFVERSSDGTPLYHFHPFFREFLIDEARQRFSPAEQATILQQTAAILDRQGNLDRAVMLYAEAGDYPALASLLLRHAEQMLAAGRGETWREWLGILPPAVVGADPWLWFWFGTMLNEVDPVSARQALLRAEDTFHSLGDVMARLVTIAALIDSYYFGLGDFSELLPWIEVIEQALAQIGSANMAADTSLRIHAGLTIARMLATPASPELRTRAKATADILARATHPATRLGAGAILLHCTDALDVDTTRWIIAELNPQVDNPAISQFTRCWWCIRAAFWHIYLDGDLGEAVRINDAGLQMIKTRPLNTTLRLQYLLKFTKAALLLIADDTDSALALMNDIKTSVAPSQKLDIARMLTLEASYQIQIGDLDKGIKTALDAIALTNDTGLPANISPHFDRFMAACYAQAQDFAKADAWCANAIAHGGDNIAETVEMRELLRALALARQGEHQVAIGLLQSALSSHRQRGRSAFFVRFPQLAAAIAGLALDLDIEKDHVRGIIKRQHLNAPDPFSANWPWPVAVRTLGSLSLSLHGDLLAFSGKAQQRPLVLLKALLLAPEHGQTQQLIADHLWPDVADARASLNVTIHRLRKLLGNDDAIIVSGGKLSINRHLVWSDVEALNHLCDEIQSLPAQSPRESLNRAATTLLSLYRGPFSEGSDESWLLSGRNRWRNRFLDAATTLGMHLEALNELAMANTLYLRALEVEPLAETMYRNLMRCAHAQNDPSAAYSAYRRCRETLSVILGKRPSAETERLAVSIGLINAAP